MCKIKVYKLKTENSFFLVKMFSETCGHLNAFFPLPIALVKKATLMTRWIRTFFPIGFYRLKYLHKYYTINNNQLNHPPIYLYFYDCTLLIKQLPKLPLCLHLANQIRLYKTLKFVTIVPRLSNR